MFSGFPHPTIQIQLFIKSTLEDDEDYFPMPKTLR